MLYVDADETVYTSLYRNRLIVVKYMADRDFEDWWEGYAEVLPEDGLDPEELMDTDDIYNFDDWVPGGLDWGGHIDLMPGYRTKREFLGFEDKTESLQDTMGTACELADQIIEYGKKRRQKLKRGAV